MKDSGLLSIGLILALTGVGGSVPARAGEPVPITAEAAFVAVATQTDPLAGFQATVALVDLRTRAEYYWVGAPTSVDAIVLQDQSVIVPDLGKVRLIQQGRFIRQTFLEFTLNGIYRQVEVQQVDHLELSPMAVNIPYKLWDEKTAQLVPNESFQYDIETLAYQGVDTVILYCRSGGRSTDCTADFNTELFLGVYEIDDPTGIEGRGGFEGTSYHNVFNGYRGFPGRPTQLQNGPSVSWKDAGLPVKTGMKPLP
jgi:rhodanese-related sulfurtransferase